MNKREIAEIKRQFTVFNCSIARICGCYVDAEKNIKADFREAFLSLPEEEIFKYFEIFRKGLSGKVGKNLFNLDSRGGQFAENEEQKFLLELRNSQLKNDDLLREFYSKVIENYDYVGNYLILLVYDAYDVPGKGSDNIEMDDASDEVYRYIMCCICPVELSKPGLSYDEMAGEFQNRIRDRVVGTTDTAFLFPAFNDRSADVHAALMYAKKDLRGGFVEKVLGAAVPLPSDYQKDGFSELIESTLGEECTSDIIKAIHEELLDLAEESRDLPDIKMLEREEIFDIISKQSEKKLNQNEFDAVYENLFGGENLMLTNLVGNGLMNVNLPGVAVKVDETCTGDVEVKMVDGRKCLVIGISGDFEINGTKCER